MSGKTPGQAAYEAYRDELGGVPWCDLPAGLRPAWDAAARAAIEAAPGVIVHVDRELSETDVAELREKFAAAVRSGHQRVLAEPAPELAAAMTESRALRALVAEILDAFVSTTHGLHPAVVREKQIAQWRERAGLTRDGQP